MKIHPNYEKLIEQKASEIRSRYAVIMESIVMPYSDKERETWPTQLKEADLWLHDPESDIPLITSMATARGISVEELVSKIKENEAAYRVAIGTILGNQQRELDLLDSLYSSVDQN